MDTSMQTVTPGKRSVPSLILRAINGLWNRIINIGITSSTSQFDKKRVRLMNGINSWGILIFLLYIFSSLNLPKNARFILYNSVAGACVCVLPLIINYYRRYNLACHLYIITTLFLFLYMSIVQGGRDAVEYIFVPLCVIPMLFFKKPRVVFLYFLANCAFFGIGKISHSLMKPIFVYETQKNLRITNQATMFFILFMIVYYYKSENIRQEKLLETKNESLSSEKQKSDNLLMNILPFETAEELKLTGTAKSRSFSMVTVMFTDFRNFTAVAEAVPPEKLVNEIHSYFSVFDQVISKYNIEKIKTIGDSYMCAGGLPEENGTNPADVVMAALEIQQFMEEKKQQKLKANELFFECRLGIHTGPVVAGIVGTKKFAYDIWGDTVNVASRMENCGEVGKVNISGNTYQLVKDQFKCNFRGKIPAKNKGEVEMYFVEGPVA